MTYAPAPCVYCGQLTQRRSLKVAVCPSHGDLPRLDPAYRPLPDPWRLARKRRR